MRIGSSKSDRQHSRALSFTRTAMVAAGVILALGSSAPAAELRGFWADIWGVGFKSEADITDMVNRAVQGRYNCIFMEALGYHDNRSSAHGAYWNSNIVPKAPDIIGGIDPLAVLCSKAHAQGLQVHAWLVPYRSCDVWPPLGNTYLSNHDELLMVPRASMNAGPVKFGDPSAYYLDPGSPDVQEYLLSIVRELVTNYPIDGIHFDIIRYMQTDAGYPARTSYANSSLKRFQRITGRSDTPAATGDTAWNDFRRRGITELVRRCRAEIPTLTNPRQPVRLSAALITWGNAPSTFQSSNAYILFQNWEEWQRLGYLDTAIPMTYYAESSYPTWYRNWVDKEMTWRYNRHMVVGPAVYFNTFTQSITQFQYARNAGADGICSYNYRDTRSDSGSNWDWYPYVAANFFTSTDTVPAMPWRNSSTATEGTLWGRVTDATTGNPIDDAGVQVGSMSTVKTDANGYYTVTLITAGASGTTYLVSAGKSGYPTSARNEQVVAGEVRRADFNLGAGDNPPVITEHPTNVLAAAGATALFSVQAAGSDPLGYQWQKNSSNLTNGGNISGTTTNLLQIANVSSGDQADYRCVVTNNYGTAASNAASLTLTGQSITYIVESRSGGQNYANYAETGSWTSTTGKSTAAGCTAGIGHRYCTIGSGATAVYSFTPTVAATYEVFTTNVTTSNSGNPLVHKVTHVGGTTNVNVCQNSTCTPNTCNVWYSLGQFSLNSGTTYTVTLDSSTAAGSSPSGNAGRSDAIKWQSVGVVPQVPVITQHPSNQTVCPNAIATFNVAASGDEPLSYQWQKNNANLTNGGHYSGCATTTLTISNCDAGDAANYRCVVTNSLGNATSNNASLTLKTATSITQHPTNRAITEGQTAQFTVAASGDGTLAYQWQKNASNITNGGRVSGATSAALQITSAVTGDSGGYRCVVTAGCGSATSNAATLTVSPAGQPGDFDNDGDVDLQDFGVFQSCLTGPTGPPTEGCLGADLDHNNNVDGNDLARFMQCMTGPEIPASPECAN